MRCYLLSATLSLDQSFFFFFLPFKLKARPSTIKNDFNLLYCSGLAQNPQHLWGLPVHTHSKKFRVQSIKLRIRISICLQLALLPKDDLYWIYIFLETSVIFNTNWITLYIFFSSLFPLTISLNIFLCQCSLQMAIYYLQNICHN